jgi:ATP-binding cassette subfamily B multidrug efflux pump
MLRLIKHLRPFLTLILLAIALLFIQANADLALPDYLSRIVNVGIQQGGVESAVPLAIRQSEMSRLFLFMSDPEKADVLAQYRLVDSSSPDYATNLADYPTLAEEPVYVLQPGVDKAVIERLNPVMGKALLAVSGIEQAITNPELAASMASRMGFDLSKIPAGMDVFSVLAKIPAAQRSQLMTMVDQRFAALGPSMIVQAAVAPVKAEYAALGMDTAGPQTAYILRTGLRMLLISLLSVACSVLVGYLAARTAAGLARDLRRLVFRKVESFSSTEFDRFSTASLITRSTNDITQIQMVVIMLVRMVFYAPIIGVGGVIRAMSKDVSMWWIIAVAVVTLVVLIVIVYQIAVPKFRIMQSLIDRLNLVTRESLSGMMVIRAFNRQPFEEQRFDQANLDLTRTSLFVNRVMVILMPLMMLIMNGLAMLIIWVGAHQVAQSSMQVGDMMAFMQYAMQIVFAFLMLSMMFIILPRADVAANRVADVLEAEISIRDPEAPQRLPEPFRGSVEFRNVSFRYPGAEEDVLHDISFTARPGQTTAIIGTTGSGKSTIVSLIPRFYEVTTGAICLDGVDIRSVTQHDLRDKIGYIPQRSVLFSGTIESNLRYADADASDERLRTSADIAQATEFISTSPEGMAAEIAQGGANVSGGQKQRLAIARALVKRPPIYIFDDSFSSLDFKTDAALRRALKAGTAASTVLIVTQRISTIKNAEQIIILDEGRIVGQGPHAELMQTCEPYRVIAQSQLSEEELR